MKFFKPFFLFSFLFLVSSYAQNGIQDIIKPVNLIAGKTDSMLISDMFYSNNYDLKFKENKKVKVNYNKRTGKIYFKADMNFAGMTLVDFKLAGNTYSFPVRSRVQQKFKFSYKPEKKYNKLTLFGSFNGWDRGNLPMKDENGDGIFETEVALEPGRYEYKFWGDGEEIVDPNNPNKKPNGFGDFNSLFNVANPDAGKLFLHVAGKEISKNESEFSFIYENEKDGNGIEQKNIIALLNNQRIDKKYIKIKNENIEFSFSKNHLKGKNLFCVAINKNGRSTNIQSIILLNGIPADNNNFTWNDGIIYSLMIDRFNDGDKSLNKPIVHDSLFEKANYMGGDFQGIINKINDGYFDSLGINTIWISPVYDNPDQAYKESPAPHRWFSGYHGYWPISSFDVEEKFGTIEKLKEIVSTAHKHKIKILLDFVANHVHENHPLVKQHPEWFGKLQLPDGRLNLRLWDEQRLTTWFEPYLPKFNFVGSKEVIDFQTSNAVWWLKTTNADGFRQDAVKHMPNEFWRALNQKIKKEIELPMNVSIYQIGETFGSYELISSYVNNGQLSAQFNFNLYDIALPTFLDKKMSFNSLDAELKKSFLVYGENNLMGNIMDSHDKNRFMAFADGDLELSQWSATEEGWNNPPKVDNPANYEKAKLYYAYMNTIPGLPVIYYGSEFGMTGASDPDNRRMMRFGNDLSKDERKMLEDVRKTINVRKEHPALRYGDFLTLRTDENIYSYIRSDMNERILIILNKSENPQQVELQLPDFYKINSVLDVISGEKIKVKKGKLEITVKGVGFRFLLL
ncbi:MAG: alpha-amylase family glycosyl hydrolase [Ignavibacteriales bacterium]|nr:alpha-amylase family glycosyl hydrolase [Ignavibacteriales bacterium]